MAVANTKSLVVTARDATPNTLTTYGGIVKTVGGTIATLAADDDGSVYRMCRLSSSARILAIRTTNGTVTGGTDYDFGAYQTEAARLSTRTRWSTAPICRRRVSRRRLCRSRPAPPTESICGKSSGCRPIRSVNTTCAGRRTPSARPPRT